MKRLLRTIVRRTPLYAAYRGYLERRSWRLAKRRFLPWTDEDQRRLAFYRPFVTPGDVVFDVGANLGNRAKVFSRLGAVVVAVEPQAACADFLEESFRGTPDVHLVRSALGAARGEAEMSICGAHTISSLSHDWIRSVVASDRFADHVWNRRERVPVDTLDHLMARFGRPSFIKIDVEGFEDQVVAGLSRPVPALSMEFTPEYLTAALRCIDHLAGLGDVRFQYSLGESMAFALPEWVGADAIREALAAVPAEAVGDLYARFDG